MTLAAFLVVCVVWGSTYLAIRVGVQEIPPASFGGLRFLLAGGGLFLITRMMGQALPRRRDEWVTIVVVGLLLVVGGNGLVMWGEQYVTSGAAAIIVVTVSLWMAVFDVVIPGSRSKPTLGQFVGLGIGFGGTLLLMGGSLRELSQADWRGPIALTMASALWALGSLLSQRRPVTATPWVAAGLQMLVGGVAMLGIAAVRGEFSALAFTARSTTALLYLAVVGAGIAYTAYLYVLKHWPATVVGTYVYANVVVAVFLGWLLLDEPVTGRTFVSTAIVVAAVVWVRGDGGRWTTALVRRLRASGRRLARAVTS